MTPRRYACMPPGSHRGSGAGHAPGDRLPINETPAAQGRWPCSFVGRSRADALSHSPTRPCAWTALVTGANQGLGRALVEGLAARMQQDEQTAANPTSSGRTMTCLRRRRPGPPIRPRWRSAANCSSRAGSGAALRPTAVRSAAPVAPPPSSGRACGPTAFKRERSTGAGALVRRIGQSPLSTWFVAMDEGFTLVCQIARTEPAVAGTGVRVRVVRAVAPREQGLPLVELTYRTTPLERRR
ncbi:hypothetical protein QFZ22_009425 [Streptomyces canus]|uniref:SDR family NAD(P)-dependent oxidoreductase n=1 Tax=Streptomyces canus TaxID=58343 RepID=A0AAW8FVZ4_9ACTN|nr:hypothetical protein [Streptomyces canus]